REGGGRLDLALEASEDDRVVAVVEVRISGATGGWSCWHRFQHHPRRGPSSNRFQREMSSPAPHCASVCACRLAGRSFRRMWRAIPLTIATVRKDQASGTGRDNSLCGSGGRRRRAPATSSAAVAGTGVALQQPVKATTECGRKKGKRLGFLFDNAFPDC